MSNLIFLSSVGASGVSHNFTVNYDKPIVLQDPKLSTRKKYQIGLVSANIWYSWHNIDADFNNNTLRYYNGTAWKTVTIPDGNYQLADINEYLHAVMSDNGDKGTDSNGDDVFYASLEPNLNTIRTKVILSNSYQLDMSIGTLYALLGLNAVIYTTSSEGTNKVDISRGFSSGLIHCSVATGAYENSKSSDAIYMFSPDVPPGAQIQIKPNVPKHLPVFDDPQIKSIRMWVTDQSGNMLDLNGEDVSYCLELMEVN